MKKRKRICQDFLFGNSLILFFSFELATLALSSFSKKIRVKRLSVQCSLQILDKFRKLINLNVHSPSLEKLFEQWSMRSMWSEAEVFYNVNYVNVNYSVKNSTVDCKYLLFLQDFFFRLKPKQYKKCQYS